MEERIKEAVLALAKLVPSAAVLDELLDSSPDSMIDNAPANVAWWLGYLQGAADEADLTVRTMLDEYGVSIEDSFPALPAPKRKVKPKAPTVVTLAKALEQARKGLVGSDEDSCDVTLCVSSEKPGWVLNVGHPGYQNLCTAGVLRVDTDPVVLAGLLLDGFRSVVRIAIAR